MPKVIFRPNATPPPFPPPTPIYDTEVHFDFDPYPYVSGDGVELTFQEVSLPPYSTWTILENDGNLVFEPRSPSNIVSNISLECNTEYHFYSGMQLTLNLFDENDNVVYQCAAICDNH